MALSRSNKVLLTSLGIVIALGGLMFLAWKSFRPYRVPSGSMAPAIPPGSHVFVDEFAYSSPGQIRRGDVVSFETPESYSKISRNASAIFVFRVIGLPGDTIDFDSKNNYTINGEPIELALRGDRVFERQADDWYEISAGGSRAISRGLSLAVPVKFPVKIPVDQFFVSGDNRANALGSRYWGTVTFELVRGRVRID